MPCGQQLQLNIDAIDHEILGNSPALVRIGLSVTVVIGVVWPVLLVVFAARNTEHRPRVPGRTLGIQREADRVVPSSPPVNVGHPTVGEPMMPPTG